MADGGARAAPAGVSGGWLARRGPWARAGLAALAGAAMALSQPPASFPWVLALCLPAILWLIAAARGPWGAAAVGWAAGYGYFVAGLHWIGHAFLVDADRFAWLLPLPVAGLPACLALWWGLAGAAAWAVGRGTVGRAVAFAGALTLAEAARGHAFTGFPWALPGYAWVETPVAQAAAWAGPYGLTLATLLGFGLLAAGPRRLPFWAGIAAIAGIWAAGSVRLDAPAPGPLDGTPPVLRIVQPNAEQHLKWEEGHRERFARRLMEESAAPPGPLGPPDAVIWPEIAVTFLPQDAPRAVEAIAGSAGGAPLVTGALSYTRDAEGTRHWRNSALAISPAGEILDRYDKQHLVPFGEYLPFRGLLSALGLDAVAGMTGGGFVPGTGPRGLGIPGLPPVAPAICYEIVFPAEVIGDRPRPDWILHLTNDAWFGRFAGPQQHLAQTRMRAIEQGLPVVRAANTGISAVIDARGRVTARLGLGAHGHLDAALPPALPATLYSRTGDWPAWAAAALLVGLAAAADRRGRA